MKSSQELQIETRQWAFTKLEQICNRYACWHLIKNDTSIPRLPRWKMLIISVFNL